MKNTDGSKKLTEASEHKPIDKSIKHKPVKTKIHQIQARKTNIHQIQTRDDIEIGDVSAFFRTVGHPEPAGKSQDN